MFRSPRTWFASVCLSLFAASLAPAQTPPAGGNNYFGAPAGQAFTQDGVFGKPPTPPEPPKVPPTDGGLLPVLEAPPPPPKIWKGSVDAGLNGATGNTEIFNGRIGINADRKTDTNFFHTDFLYTLATQSGKTIQNAAILNARDEILFPGSPWSLFTATNIEYDQLRDYKFRVGIYAGVGYLVIDNKITLFKLRSGAGAVREIGGPKDRWVPELDLGYDFKHKFTDRQSLVSTLDYYPRIDDPSQFRLRARIAYEIIVDPKSGMFVRLGAQTRYDSDPGPGFKHNDLNYFATFGVSF